MESNDTSPFDVVLRTWPGGEHIAEHWRDDPKSFVLLNPGDSPSWVIEAIVATFPSAPAHRSDGFSILIAEAFPARLCEWYDDAYDTTACATPVAELGACGFGFDDTGLAQLLARGVDNIIEWSGETIIVDDSHAQYLTAVAVAANAAGAPLELAIELAPSDWQFDIDTFASVLRTAHRG